MKKEEHLPLIYSCSGCSNIAQLANRVAVALDREGLAEMSCIAGVGGNVNSLVHKAQSGREIIALDGCQLHCVKNCLAQCGVTADSHYTLTDFDLKKQYGIDCSEQEYQSIRDIITNDPLLKA